MFRLIQRAPGAEFPRPAGMSPLLHTLLQARGIDGLEAAERFFNPSPDQFHDPSAFRSMNEAVSLIRRAQTLGWTVCVYGDYDVDGLCAAAILLGALGGLGVSARAYIPSRHKEGYGLNDAAIREIADWANLLITVDCGVSAAEPVRLARSLGLEVIVTDHHQPGMTLPECPLVNPLLSGYPYPFLCGAGVAFKLAAALDQCAALEWMDLAALATVADVVPLTGENRVIVSLGLRRIRERPRPGLMALMEIAGVNGAGITAGNIAFQLAPRLNASGRLGDATRALRLLLSGSAEEARPWAEALEKENSERRHVEAQILGAAFEQMRGFDFARGRSVVLHGEDWNAGVIGLVAARLVEKYGMPVILLTGAGETLHGSCRSIPDVDIYQALSACSRHLIRFGGHRQAAGLTMARENLVAFRGALDAHLFTCTLPEHFVPTLHYDAAVPFDQMDEACVRLMSRLEPFGMGNPPPLLLADVKVEQARVVGRDGEHLSLQLSQGGARIRGIAFRMAREMPRPDALRRILFTPKLNEWRGVSSVQAEVRALLPLAYEKEMAQYERDSDRTLQMFLTERLYTKEYRETEEHGEPLEDAAALRSLAAFPLTTLVVLTDWDRLSAFLALARTSNGWFDLLLGRWPEGDVPRNAVCFCPKGSGAPEGYRRCFFLDAPASLWPDPTSGCECFGGGGAAWMRRLPGEDQLRVLYSRLRDVSSRPSRFESVQGLINSLVQEGGMDGVAAAAGLVVLWDMKLVDLSLEPPKMTLLSPQKRNLRESRVFRYIERLSGR